MVTSLGAPEYECDLSLFDRTQVLQAIFTALGPGWNANACSSQPTEQSSQTDRDLWASGFGQNCVSFSKNEAEGRVVFTNDGTILVAVPLTHSESPAK